MTDADLAKPLVMLEAALIQSVGMLPLATISLGTVLVPLVLVLWTRLLHPQKLVVLMALEKMSSLIPFEQVPLEVVTTLKLATMASMAFV